MKNAPDLEQQQIFLEEAEEFLVHTKQCLASLLTDPKDIVSLQKIFRLVHTIKGSAKAVGFGEFGQAVDDLETLIHKIEMGEIPLCTDSIEFLFKCDSFLSKSIEEMKSGLDSSVHCSEVRKKIGEYLNGLKKFAK